MNSEFLLLNISRYISLEPKEQEFFLSMLQFRKIRKRGFLLQEGEICTTSTFITKGCLRGFTIDTNGSEHILSFAPEGWWIADMYSYITQQPGTQSIEAIENTEVLQLSKTNQDTLFETVPKFERFFRIIVEKSLVSHQQRLIESLSMPAEERYETFLKRYPMLVERLSQKYIAAYIGVTPEFFSKMRTSVLRRK